MENNYITLSQIGLYNPQRLNDEVVEKLYVIRLKLFQFLMDKLKKEKPDSIPQHYLLIAQRGMGKTLLLKRIEVELRKTDNNNSFIPLLFPEEQYNLKNLSEFWLNSLDALADTLEYEQKKHEAKQIDDKISKLLKIQNIEDRAKEAYQFLKSFTNTTNRRPVLLIDNMSLIFDRLDKDEQHTLRSWLMQKGAPIILGASVAAIEETLDYGAPFYDAFQIQYLKKLTFEELVELLTNLARLTQSEGIIPEINSRIARLKTLHQLTGGNPRTATMLFKLIIKGFAEEINDDLGALLDEITPLYKARFEELSTQMQVIVDATALFWDPITIEQLRTETGYDNNQLSPQLKRLADAGWIEKITAYKAKGSAFQISERFFNIWFLMRRSSRRKKRELYCLSRFLESFYGEELKNIALNNLQSKSTCPDHVTYGLALAEAIKDENLKSQLKEKAYSELQELAKINPELLKQFDLPNKTDGENISKLLSQYIDEFNKNNFENAEKLLFEILEIEETSNILKAIIQNEFGCLYKNQFQKYDEAEIAYKKAINLDDKFAFPWNNLGNLYQDYLKKYAEAEIAYKKAIDLDGKDASPWNGLGNLYRDQLQKYAEAEIAFKKAIELDGMLPHPWNGLGNLYLDRLQKFEEAEIAYKKAIELNEKGVYAKFNLVFLYRDKMNKYSEAEVLFNSIKPDTSMEDSYWLNKALFDLYKKNEGIAKDYFIKALYKIEDKLPENTRDDWWRFGAVVNKLKYNDWALSVMEETGHDVILSPFYVAIKAMNEKDTEGYLNSKALEIREPAMKIIDLMKKY
jgi:tetratricopeptide (TPR) repeat protein